MRALITALAAGLACLASPAAGAQQPTDQDPGLWCVYEALETSFDYEIVAEAYLFDDDKTGDPEGLLEKASTACADKHGLSDVQMMASAEYGRFGSIITYLIEEMVWTGITEDEAGMLFELTDELSDDDYEALFEDGWQTTDVGTRVKAQLAAAKFPQDPDAVAAAMQIIGLIVLADEAEMIYVLDKLDAEGN